MRGLLAHQMRTVQSAEAVATRQGPSGTNEDLLELSAINFFWVFTYMYISFTGSTLKKNTTHKQDISYKTVLFSQSIDVQ